MERRLQELRDSYERDNAENERRLRRELKRTKALLRDSQTVIDEMEKKLKDKNQVKVLKDKLEDAEYSAQVAIKGKKKVEDDLHDVQSQLDSVTKTKIEVINTMRCLFGAGPFLTFLTIVLLDFPFIRDRTIWT